MGAYDELLAWKKAAAEQKPVEMTDCPNCGWDLEKNQAGVLHCEYCGWTNK